MCFLTSKVEQWTFTLDDVTFYCGLHRWCSLIEKLLAALTNSSGHHSIIYTIWCIQWTLAWLLCTIHNIHGVHSIQEAKQAQVFLTTISYWATMPLNWLHQTTSIWRAKYHRDCWVHEDTIRSKAIGIWIHANVFNHYHRIKRLWQLTKLSAVAAAFFSVT